MGTGVTSRANGSNELALAARLVRVMQAREVALAATTSQSTTPLRNVEETYDMEMGEMI